MEKKVYRRARGGQPRPGALLALFFALLFGFSLLNAVWPKRHDSELENRVLASMPAFSVRDLLNGRWSKAFGSYMQDQVALRDLWLRAESAVGDIALAWTEEGGILLGRDGWMFTKQFALDDGGAQLQRNLDAVCGFAARWPGRVTFMLAPSAAVLYPEMLPAGAPMIDEAGMLDTIFDRVEAAGARVVDLRADLAAHKQDSLYYKTDHHWTTQGAYRAYCQFCALRGLQPFALQQAQAVAVPGFYGTHYSSTRRWDVIPDTLTYYPLPNQQTIYQITGDAQFTARQTTGLVDSDKLAGRDKYGAFLGGNHGYSVVDGDGEGSLLVVKDSYANCFIPFLTANYKKIGVVDLRGTNYGVDATIRSEGYDEVLILYNFQTFVSDSDVPKLARSS